MAPTPVDPSEERAARLAELMQVHDINDALGLAEIQLTLAVFDHAHGDVEGEYVEQMRAKVLHLRLERASTALARAKGEPRERQRLVAEARRRAAQNATWPWFSRAQMDSPAIGAKLLESAALKLVSDEIAKATEAVMIESLKGQLEQITTYQAKQFLKAHPRRR